MVISYRHDTYQSEAGAKENWQVLNPETEKLIEQHQCYETKRQCLDQGAKHFAELVVDRPCWKEQITYQCSSVPVDGCKYLKDRNCTLQKSTCLDLTVKPCLRWQREYLCKTKTETIDPSIVGSEIFCLDGNCHKPVLGQNTDMARSVAQLAIFKEMQNDMEKSLPPKVFKGEAHQCTKYLTNYKNCCSSLKGWGVSLGLDGCCAEEKALAQKRERGLCHYVGTYCAEKGPFGICLRKKSSFCCFSSKLARIFQQQGRSQIAMNWGSGEDPDCRGLSTDELTQLDFSRMDLSELYQHLFANMQQKAAKDLPRQFKNQMPTMQSNIIQQRQEYGCDVKKQVF